MIRTPFSHRSIALMLAVFALTACGKNMHVSLKDKPTQDLQAKATDKDTGKKSDADVDANIGANDAVQTDGELQPYSKYDLSELGPKIGKVNPIREIGDPSLIDQSTQIGFTRDSSLVFRAIVPVPSKANIQSILNFELVLKGLRIYDPKGSSLKERDFSGQNLCIADTALCSDQVANADDEFAKVKAEKILDYGQNGAVFEAKGENGSISLDLKKVFHLESLSTAELVDWIYANSTEYAEPGYRKFRFVMANNVFLESGQLLLQFESAQPVDQVAGEPKHGSTDAQFDTSSGQQSSLTDVPMKKTQDLSIVSDANGNSATIPANAVPSDAIPADAKPGVKVEAKPSVKVEAKPNIHADASIATVETQSSAPIKPSIDANAKPSVKVTPVVASTVKKPITVIAPLAPIETVKTITIETPKITANVLPLIVIQQKAGEPELQLNLDGSRLLFALNKASILADGKARLIATAGLIHGHSDVVQKVKITGHTDKTGRPEYNRDLSKKRAQAVAEVLFQSGIEKAKLALRGVGEPTISSCDPKQDCPQDRRVDIQIKLNDDLTVSQKNAAIQDLNQGLLKIWKNSVVKSN